MDWCWSMLILVVPLYYIVRYIWELIPVGGLTGKCVLITGCDTGFGRQLALKCLKSGMTVFAGCLTQQGADSLKSEADRLKGKLHTVLLDITDDGSVRKARKYVEEHIKDGSDLWAVVNNAGVFSCFGPDDWCSIDEYKASMNVNFFGAIRVTHAFKPLLKRSKGRIVTTSSVAGRIAFPSGAPYSAAKYAIEAYMDTIRQELRVFGVGCSIVEPGIFKTNLIEKGAMLRRIDHVWNRLTEEQRAEYGEAFKKNFGSVWNEAMDSMGSSRTDYVVDNYYHAITARYPRCRYRCGWDCLLFYVPITYLPTEFVDWVFRSLGKDFPIAALVSKKTV